MPIDPMTGLPLPYDEPLPSPYEGPWPPPEWDQPINPYPVSPEAEQAAAAADALFAEQPQVQLGMPRPVTDDVVAPIDDALITMGDEEPTAPPLTEDEKVQRMGELDQQVSTGDAAQDIDSPDLIDPFGESLQQRTDQLSDFDLAQKQYLSDQAAEEQRQASVLRAAQADRQAAEDDERIYRGALEIANQKQAEVDAEATRLANEKVDPDGWRSSRSTFQTIAMYVAGVVGGLVQGRAGGRNIGLDMIDAEIERHIQAQQANLNHRRQLLGDKRASVQNMRALAEADDKARAAFRQAAYQRAFEEAEAAKLQFDPMGNRARQYSMFQRELAARAMAAQQQNAETLRKRAEDDLRLQMDLEKHAADMAYKQAQTGKLRGVGGGGGASAAKLKRPVSEWNQLFPGANVPDDGTPRTLAEYRQLGETGKSLTAPTEGEKLARADEKEAEATTLRNPLARPGAKGERHFINADGSPARAGDPARATAINDQVSAATTLAQIVARQKELIAKASATDLANPRSDVSKLLKGNQATIANLLRTSYKMGTLDEAALKIADAVQGGDPTAFLGDASVGLEQMLVQAEMKLDNDLKGPGGWRPKEDEFFRLPRYDAAAAKSDRDVDAAAGKEVKLKGGVSNLFGGPEATRDQELGVIGLTGRARAGAVFEPGNPQYDDAIEAIQNLAALAGAGAADDKAQNPAQQTAAAKALQQLADEGNVLAKAKLAAIKAEMAKALEGE